MGKNVWVTVGRLLPLARWLAGVPPMAAHVGKVLPYSSGVAVRRLLATFAAIHLAEGCGSFLVAWKALEAWKLGRLSLSGNLLEPAWALSWSLLGEPFWGQDTFWWQITWLGPA